MLVLKYPISFNSNLKDYAIQANGNATIKFNLDGIMTV